MRKQSIYAFIIIFFLKHKYLEKVSPHDIDSSDL